MEIKCETCGKVFISKNSYIRFCSSSCSGTQGIITGVGLPRNYKGFRSLHEYRFAGYLEKLGIQFRYEEEGILLQNEQGGDRHLVPDFYIPSRKLYIEIEASSVTKLKRHKILWFQEQHPKEKLIIVTGKDVKNLIRGNLKIFY